eukprot:CAMPEP_0116840494 /NCGR_PEP_ID=MMETSP0418-20121206/10386_1 /TAXON_ID=1158023 /ORGANISM="Astrosyne radiata, Strain 13vi08-1A" /LENGTH=146 /DNA_ID=CAMNT_0004470787 /DNA_START=66 /DNA_END=502 /DNA_ORIENTATION=+
MAWAFAPQPVVKTGTKLQALFGYDAGQFKAPEGKAAWEIAEEKMAEEKAKVAATSRSAAPGRGRSGQRGFSRPASEKKKGMGMMLGYDPNEAAKNAPPNHDYFALDTAPKSASGNFGWDSKASASSHDERMSNMRKPKRAGRVGRR